MARLSRSDVKVLGSLAVLILVVLWQVFSGLTGLSETDLQPLPSAGEVAGEVSELVPVVSVVDGDTFKVESHGKIETVRLVGVNTPETVDPRRPVECYGREASAFLKKLLQDQSVRLESDPTQSDRDRYGRLLRFAFLADGRDVGLLLLQNGMAEESLYSDDPHRYHDIYITAHDKAQTEAIGLWNESACK